MQSAFKASSPAVPVKKIVGSNDITLPIALTAPGSQFGQRPHPVQPTGFSGIDLQKPIETNKWWGTLPVPGAQTGNVFAFPYTLWWGNANPCGMNIQHVEASQIVFDTANTPPQYYLNPLGIISWNMGASEFDTNMKMTMDTPTQFTINVDMSPSAGAGSIKMPLVEGMAFITGIYSGLTPLFQTVGHAVLSFQASNLTSSTTKYKVGLNDGTTWLIYVFSSSGSSYSLSQSGSNIVGNGKFNGYVQIAKIPLGDTGTSEASYDAHAGTYVTSMTLFGSTEGSTGTYGYNFGIAGKSSPSSGSVLHFALPHHQASFNATTQSTATGIYLQSTTMGKMRAYTALQWTMTETLPTNILFLPSASNTFSASTITALNHAVNSDIGFDVSVATTQNTSQYYAGKAMAKYAEIALVCSDILKNPTLTATALTNLKAAFNVFAKNQQNVPLCYDTTWKGLISTAGLPNPPSSPDGNSGFDFGNTWYNDHHFHYGYFVYAAALLGHMDPTWLTAANVDYINSLVRDVANPSPQDPYFPVFRSFDWFVGHSWSKGLFFSGDGKDEESSSEDYNFSYGLKLWGLVTNNVSVQGCGDLMLAVQRRAMNSYMLMSPGNTIQPQPFVPNFVSGILFMNKADHTTYFGIPNSPTNNLELTHGIHMIPLTPISPFIRLQSFVTAEWQAKLATIVGQVNSGWRGILMANLAISDPQTAWNFFTTGFQSSWLDDGASLTWYLAFTAGLLAGGNPATSPATVTTAAAAIAAAAAAVRDGQHVL